MSSYESKSPRVEACIEAVSRRFPSPTSTAYYTEVHQHLAPLARELEADNEKLRAQVEQLNNQIKAGHASCQETKD